MAASTSGSASSATAASASIGKYVQMAGAAVFAAGAVLSLHHFAIALCFLGGAAAFLVGKKLRGA